jgi:hypothetical protein
VVGVLVLLGIAFGSQWWKVPDLRQGKRAIEEAIDAAPTTAEGKLTVWAEFADPQVHACLQQMRLSPELPWLVTHAVRPEGATSGPVEMHGVDLRDLAYRLVEREGMLVRLRLPEPVPLGTAELSGEMARYVPVYAAGMRVPDPAVRLSELVLRALGELPAGLAKDIEGARFEVVVGPGRTWAEVLPADAEALPGIDSGAAPGTLEGGG